MRRLATDTRQDTDRAGNLMGQRLATRLSQSMNRRLRERGLKVEIDTELNNRSVAATEVALRRVTRNREVDVRINRRTLGRNLGLAGQAIGQFLVSTIRILGDFFNFGRQIGQVLGEAFKSLAGALSGSGQAAVSLGAAFTQLAATAAALAAVLLIMVGIFGVILAAASALYQAILLILTVVPALGLSFLLALGPLVLIFTNLGEAIKATAGDVDDFNDAVEGLGGNTASVLGRLRGLVQFFIGIREVVQEAFFEPISEALDNLKVDLGPVFQAGFENVAAAAGRFAAAFIDLFNHPNTERFFEQLFGLAELGFDEVGGAIVDLVGAFANLINQTFPQAQDAVTGIGDTIRGWADGINDFASDPALDEKLETWKESFNTIVELIGTAVELAQTLLNGFAEDGIPVLEHLNGQMERFIEFLESERGAQFFDGLRIAALAFLVLLEALLIPIILFIEFLGIIEELFKGNVTDAVNSLNDGPLGTLLGLGGAILHLIFQQEGAWNRVRAVAAIFGGVVGFIASRVRDVGGAVQRVREFFAGVARVVGDLVRRIGNLSGALGPVVGLVRLIAGAFQAALNIASRIAGVVSNISFPSVPTNLIPFLAEGGIFTKPTTAVIGEAGPEVVIPLSNPRRAMELVNESGLLNLIRGGDGASAPSPGGILLAPEVRVFIGDQELKGMIKTQIFSNQRTTRRRVGAGTGGAR